MEHENQSYHISIEIFHLNEARLFKIVSTVKEYQSAVKINSQIKVHQKYGTKKNILAFG